MQMFLDAHRFRCSEQKRGKTRQKSLIDGKKSRKKSRKDLVRSRGVPARDLHQHHQHFEGLHNAFTVGMARTST
jgi:hypothetical protein